MNDCSVDRSSFVRIATSFINKLAPDGADDAANAFVSSDAWSQKDRPWRIQAFAALVIRHFAKVSRSRPARGSLFRELSVLGAAVQSLSPLLVKMPDVRAAVYMWLVYLLGCQSLFAQRRLDVCAAHHPRAVSRGSTLAVLPPVLLRRVLGYVWPEREPEQRIVEFDIPPRADLVEVAIVFGHLQSSGSAELWPFGCPLGLDCVDALLRSFAPGPWSGGEVALVEQLHAAGVILLAACEQLERRPLPGRVHCLAGELGRKLATVATEAARLPGFVRFRINAAVAAAKALEGEPLSHLTSASALSIDYTALPPPQEHG